MRAKPTWWTGSRVTTTPGLSHFADPEARGLGDGTVELVSGLGIETAERCGDVLRIHLQVKSIKAESGCTWTTVIAQGRLTP